MEFLGRRFYIFLIKRNNELLIKGLSWDKTTWYKMPNNIRNLKDHPQIEKYKSVRECISQGKVKRMHPLTITAELKPVYLTDDGSFMFNGTLLELDNSITDETILNEKKRDLESEDFVNPLSNSTPKPLTLDLNKKSKIVYDVSDIQACIVSILDHLGKFTLFKHQPEVYLSKLVNHIAIDTQSFNNPLDSIVNHFSKLLDVELHEWYWESIFQQGLSFEEFQQIFVEHIQKVMYLKINNVHLTLDKYLETLNNDNKDNRFSTYFNHKSRFYNLYSI